MAPAFAATAAAVSACVVVGVLVGTGVASADTFPEPRHERVWALDGGGHAAVGSQDEQITRVQPLTTNGTTKEFFADVEAFGELSVPDGAPVSAVLSTGFQIGCMAAYTGTTFGISVKPDIGIGGQIGTDPKVEGTAGIEGTPSVSVQTGAGRVTEVELVQRQLATTLGIVRVGGAHLKVDGCIGPVTARSYTRFQVSTGAGVSSNSVYGQVFPL